jgi:hypothetical protein
MHVGCQSACVVHVPVSAQSHRLRCDSCKPGFNHSWQNLQTMAKAMTAQGFRRIALALDGVIEGAHMGHPDFRVDKRIFASLHHENQFGMVKLTPDQQASFIEDHPTAFAPEAGAWGRSGCTRVILKAVDEDALGEALTLAWRNTRKTGRKKGR